MDRLMLTPKNTLIKIPTSMASTSEKVQTDNTKNSIVIYENEVERTRYTCNSADQESSAMKLAFEVQEKLSSEFPSFIKSILRSHVTGGFWLSFPKSFATVHLPKEDVTVVLKGEDESVYHTNYLVNKNGLSGGWRAFAIAHKLVEGDVLIFQLIEPMKFKVYIVRSHDLTHVESAICLLQLGSGAKPIDQIEPSMEICDAQGTEYIEYPESSNADVMESIVD